MASWQAHLTDLLLRVQMKSKMRGNTDLLTARKLLGQGRMPQPDGVVCKPATLGGIAGEWVTAVAAPADPVATLLYLHGGGYFACSPKTHRQITAAYAKAGFNVFVPDYRLAPEHPFPAALEDAKAAWDGLLALGHAPHTMAVSGDSAGGGLSLALLLSLRDAGADLPAAAALFSPWTDLAGTGESITTNAERDAMFWAPGLVAGGQYYLGGADPKTPLASPLYADLAGLPPLLIHCGEREILRDDSTRLAQRAQAAGVKVELKVWPVVSHVWQLAPFFIPEARESLGRAGAFLQAQIALATPLSTAA